jgi:hypothetical protein
VADKGRLFWHKALGHVAEWNSVEGVVIGGTYDYHRA